MLCLSAALSAVALLDDLLATGLRRVLAALESELLLEGSSDEFKALLVHLLQTLLLLGRLAEVLVFELLGDELAASGSFRFGAVG